MTGQCSFRCPDNSSTVIPSMPGLPLLAFTRRSACLQFSRSQTSSIHCSVVGLSALRFANSDRSEEHTSELQSQSNLVCRLLLEKKNPNYLSVASQHVHVLLSA